MAEALFNPNYPVVVCVALPCEAKPFIQRWRLKKDTSVHPYALYRQEQLTLVVSGPGKTAMAGALAYTLAKSAIDCQPVLVNLGIAGRRSGDIGSLWRVNKISDNDSGKVFYPGQIARFDGNHDALITVAKPDDSYVQPYLYDMEAAAFYETAVKFSSCELISCLKVLSDNAETPLTNIDESQVIAWLTQQTAAIEHYLLELTALAGGLPIMDNRCSHDLQAQHHFSQTQSQQLKAQLQRWQVLNPDLPWPPQAREFTHAKQVLAALQQDLEQLPFSLSPCSGGVNT